MDVNTLAKKTAQRDWHPAEIVCELRKAGWSLRKLSLHHGYATGTLKTALNRRWPKGERLIAAALGIPATKIWPSRYSDQHDSPASIARQLRSGKSQ